MNHGMKSVGLGMAGCALMAMGLAGSGCTKDKPPAAQAEHPAAAAAQEHPAAKPATNPAAAKPKDHPAH
jgi:hypothetical protein